MTTIAANPVPYLIGSAVLLLGVIVVLAAGTALSHMGEREASDLFDGNRDFTDGEDAEVWDITAARRRRDLDHPAVRHHREEGA